MQGIESKRNLCLKSCRVLCCDFPVPGSFGSGICWPRAENPRLQALSSTAMQAPAKKAVQARTHTHTRAHTLSYHAMPCHAIPYHVPYHIIPYIPYIHTYTYIHTCKLHAYTHTYVRLIVGMPNACSMHVYMSMCSFMCGCMYVCKYVCMCVARMYACRQLQACMSV